MKRVKYKMFLKTGTNGMIATKRNSFAAIKKDAILYVMLLPYLLWLIIFAYKPMYGLLMAFKDYNPYKGIMGSQWIGLENFKLFMDGPHFLRTVKNTFVLGVYTLVFSFPAPIILAIMLNEVRMKKFKSFLQTATFLPYFISVVVICGITVNMLAPSGVVNSVIKFFGGEEIYFMTKPEWFRPIYIITGIWSGCGYSAIIYLAALAGIDPCLYEACVIDGGGKFSQIRHVTIPGILPTIVTMLIMQIGGMFSIGYEKIILLYQPVTYETADVLSTYMFRVGLSDGKYSLATAVSLFNAIISLIFVVTTNIISKRLTETALW